MPSDELHETTGQVASIAQAGLPLAPGLRALAEEVSSGRVRRALFSLSERLEGGESLDAVLAQSPKLVPPPLRALLAAAAGAGNLGLLLDRYLMLSRVNRDLKRRLWLSLAYPTLLILASLSVAAFFLLWIAPAFREMFEGFDVEIPAITVAMFKVSTFLVDYGGVISLGTLFVGGLLVIGVPLLVGRANLRRMVHAIPIVGSMLQYSGLAGFCHFLALLLEGRVRLPDALRLSGAACGDASLNQHAVELARGVEEGLSLIDATFGLPSFPQSLMHVFRWQTRGDAFADILRANAEVFEARARTQSGMLAGIIEPFVLVGVAVTVGGTVVALFMPLIKLLNELS
ncbi:MAG: type II secretion system F family protein [Planctomycetales bacterium]|nr:type II secretion system F family protein [Planctomycetales bacterium]